jgi:hypothetical protein
MDKFAIMTLADDLALSQDQILNGQQDLDTKRINKALDSLKVLANPVQSYLDDSQESYYNSDESDHKLDLLHLSEPMAAVHDRILTNHVDGFVDQNKIHLTYNHEDPYADGVYDPEVDFHVLSYSLKVIGAVYSVDPDDLRKVLSKDAVLSIALAANALVQNIKK